MHYDSLALPCLCICSPLRALCPSIPLRLLFFPPLHMSNIITSILHNLPKMLLQIFNQSTHLTSPALLPYPLLLHHQRHRPRARQRARDRCDYASGLRAQLDPHRFDVPAAGLLQAGECDGVFPEAYFGWVRVLVAGLLVLCVSVRTR